MRDHGTVSGFRLHPAALGGQSCHRPDSWFARSTDVPPAWSGLTMLRARESLGRGRTVGVLCRSSGLVGDAMSDSNHTTRPHDELPRVAVVIVTFNSAEVLPDCLGS